MNEKTMKERSVSLDLLKTAAMIAVVLYHVGFLKYGYLGVDVFFVVGGYLTTNSIFKKLSNHQFSYFSYLKKQVFRLWPIVLLASFVCIVTGFFVMLPDDYENLAESVVASNFFANNILACITTKNYWDIVNDYKPLMHMWYLGVYMQAIVVLPIIPMVVNKLFKGKNVAHKCGYIFTLLFVASLLICFLPFVSSAQRFYYVPFRLFEFVLGGLVACLIPKIKTNKKISENIATAGYILCAIFILFLLCFPVQFISDFLRLLVVCLLTAVLIVCSLKTEYFANFSFLKGISLIGKCTLSIFVWHQILLAFARYTIKSAFSIVDLFVYLAVVAVIAILSWKYIEQLTVKILSLKGGELKILVFCILLCAVTTGASMYLYFHAGVVRNVPELDVSTASIHRNMHSEYCDRGYSFDTDFNESDKIRVLVIGNSFGRDWINILLESEIKDQLDISYISFGSDEYIQDRLLRLKEADYIFYALSSNDFCDLPWYLKDFDQPEKVYIIGNKNFGENNGQIYAKRNKSDYFSTTIELSKEYILQNDSLKEKYGTHYIDMIKPLQNENGSIRVFTDDHKYISQDCRHLTKSGAKYYSSVLNLNWIVS